MGSRHSRDPRKMPLVSACKSSQDVPVQKMGLISPGDVRPMGVLQRNLMSVMRMVRRGMRAVILVPVVLGMRGAQALDAEFLDRMFPRQEFFDRKRVTFAGFAERQQPAAYRGHHLR